MALIWAGRWRRRAGLCIAASACGVLSALTCLSILTALFSPTSFGPARSGGGSTCGGVDSGALFVTGRNGQIVEDAWRTDNCGCSRFCERDLDHFQAEPRRIRVVESAVLAALELFSGAHSGCTGDVNIDVVRIAGLGDHRMRMRSAACLDAGYELWMRDVGD